jgi:phage terminase small subunit
MPGEKALTPKQAAFARAYLEHGNATMAYEQVYNSAKGMNANTLARNAHALLHSAKVQAEVKRLQEAITKKTTRTIEDSIQEQEKAMAMAEQSGNAAAYSNASMAKAKLLGFLIDRAEVRTGALDPDEARPDISSIWARTVAGKPIEGETTKH